MAPGKREGKRCGAYLQEKEGQQIAKGTLVICKGSDWNGMPDDSCGMSEIGCPDKATPNGVG